MASFWIVRPGRYIDVGSMTSEKVRDRISVLRSMVKRISDGAVVSGMMVPVALETRSSSTVVPKISVADPFSSTKIVLSGAVARDG